MTLVDAAMLADIPTSSWAESETEKIASITAPTLDALANALSYKLGALVVISNHDVVSRRTNAGSKLYDVSTQGVVFDGDIFGIWPVGTSRVGDTDREVIDIIAEGVVSNVGSWRVRHDASVVYRDTAAH